MPLEDGGPAFPAADENFGHTGHSTTGLASPGMTLRDYFAAKALPEVMAAYDRNSADDDYTVWDEKNKRLIAITAYDFADAMLEARKP